MPVPSPRAHRARTLALAALTAAAAALARTEAHAQSCAPADLFAPPSFTATLLPQRTVNTADFDHDGIQDLVICTSSGIEVHRGVLVNGELQYPLTFQQALGVGPTHTAIADLNSDGILDIVVARDGNDLIEFLGNGNVTPGVWDGTFTEAAAFSVGSAWDVQAVDVTGDGILDLVVSTRLGITILTGTGRNGHGDGKFGATQNMFSFGAPKRFVVMDLDGDGALDIVAATETPNLEVYWGTTDLTGPTHGFNIGVTPQTSGGYTYDVCVADFDGDGRLDIACTNYLGGKVTVFLQNSDRTFRTIEHAVPGVPLGLCVADMNEDGYPDLVVGASNTASTFTLLLNQGPGGTSADHLVAALAVGPPRSTYNLAVADLRGDGTLDVVAAGLGDSQLAIFTSGCRSDRLPLTTTVEGGGRIVRDPNTLSYAPGTRVSLTAFGGVGSRFVGWAGDVTGSTNPSTIVMNAPHAVTARFEPATAHLTVTVHGPGSVFRSPDQPIYAANARVRLTAVPDALQAFAGWSGDASGDANPLDVTLDTDMSIAATFVIDPLSAPAIESVADVPGDQGGSVVVRWRASKFETLPPFDQHFVSHYWVMQNRIDSWQFVAAVQGRGLQHYTFTATTANDSTDSGSAFTAFKVQARNSDDTIVYESAPDSGYSVDNLAPPGPASVSLTLVNGLNTLRWSASHAPDLARYLIHRGATADFVATDGNRIGGTTETSYTDARSGPAFYRVVALDKHGNRSDAILATPTELRFGIDAVVPNPSSDGRVTVSFTLPVDSPARLELLDIMGRIATGVTQVASAGLHTVTLGGTGMRPGLYWVRLEQQGHESITRVVVMD